MADANPQKKTAGILGDDLAVNAEKATGFQASRELPVLWAITKGSFINKLVILPLAFLLSAYIPWLIVPVLLVGGAYLSFEGAEKIYHSLSGKTHTTTTAKIVSDQKTLLRIESGKIKSAIRTDFILSIEIVIIALGTVMDKSLPLQVIVVSLIALLATVGVYGVVALIVRMDDAGYFLIKSAESMQGSAATIVEWTGSLLVISLPKVIRALGIIGTAAMLAVGGGIFVHNISSLHHIVDTIPPIFANFFTGLAVGFVLLITEQSLKAVINRLR